MCGICGIITTAPIGPDDVALTRRMADALAHRGPDDHGVHAADNVAFGHRRLSIVDIEHGAQPMTNEDGSVVLVYNGEVYNFPELREQVLSRGHRLRTRCDAEVIPHLYEDYGPDMVDMLEGMFAFALHDRRSATVLLARDSLGIKPLYYAQHAGRLVFASELKGILTDDRIPRVLDLEALHDYLSLLYCLPPRTFLSHVRELEPGSLLEWRSGTVNVRRYWRPELRPKKLSVGEAVERFEHTFRRVLSDHLMSDVPVGALLSGGIDSSLIVATLSRHLGVRPSTYSVGFGEAGYDESRYAEAVAAHCGTPHRTLRVDSGTAAVELVETVAEHFDQPFADSSAIPSYLISEAIRRETKVALSGDGADELFGGYENFGRGLTITRLSRLPNTALLGAARLVELGAPGSERARRVAKGLRFATLDRSDLLFEMQAYMGEKEKMELYAPGLASRMAACDTRDRYAPAESNGGSDIFTQMTLLKLRYNLNADMLRKVDMMSMAHGLEVRVPFLDRRLVRIALELPRRLKVRSGRNKYLLRKVAARLLPDEIASKPKWGFGIPLDTWAGAAFQDYVRRTLTGSDARVTDLVRVAAVRDLLQRFERPHEARGRWSRHRVYQNVYQLLCLELWLRRWSPSGITT